MEKKRARGIKELDRYQIDNERLTLGQAVKAMHAECMGRYADGHLDCKIPECPLYPWSPYQNTPLLSRKPHKELTNEERNILVDRLTRGRKMKNKKNINNSL